MNFSRLSLRLALGRRLPFVSGELRVHGLQKPVTIRRDQWGIPHIEAETDTDAWYGLGFCHGQDRAFQLETLQRVARGTLAELVGPAALPVDRMSRRVGFYRSAQRQWDVQPDDVKAILLAFVAGLNAGTTSGLPRLPHEFALLKANPTPWVPADVLAFLAVQSFLLSSNWDVELARLRILLADGPDALRDLDPVDLGTIASPPLASMSVLDRLAEDLALVQRYLPTGGGSNNWVIAGSRTASGKPLLANDPHLPVSVPAIWYLAHVATPHWSVAGATMIGTPAVAVGHNSFACWGVTAGLTDNTDLFLETNPTGETVREVIRVKGQSDVIEEILVTPRGPILSSPDEGSSYAVSLRAVWLEARPVRGLLDVPRARDFETFRRAFAYWPALPQNVVYADTSGTIGYQLIGQLPIRRGHNGLMPAPADAPDMGWAEELLPFEQMPTITNPSAGYLATANSDPRLVYPSPPEDGKPEHFLGADFCDSYRADIIREELAKQESGWTVDDCQQLQQYVWSRPWDEVRAIILGLNPTDADARQGLELLRDWNGHVTADSPAASVFELFMSELCVRVAKAKAPKSWASALGGVGAGPMGANMFGVRRVAHLVRLLREQPSGWFHRSWAEEITEVLTSVVRFLRKTHGPGPAWWQWGDIRPLAIDHPVLGKHRIFGPIFNLPRMPYGGDSNTVSQATCRPLAPTAPAALAVAGLRAVFDTADWSNCRFALAGGQSGNPFSPHYADLFHRWYEGEGVPIPFTPEAVFRAAKTTLRLTPAGSERS